MSRNFNIDNLSILDEPSDTNSFDSGWYTKDELKRGISKDSLDSWKCNLKDFQIDYINNVFSELPLIRSRYNLGVRNLYLSKFFVKLEKLISKI